jgi:hypothetical protein
MMDAFFVTWNLELVQISTAFAGPRLIGHCMFAVIPAPPPPPVINAPLAKNHGVVYLQGDNGGLIPVPVTVANNSIGFSPPGMTTPAAARECMDQSTNRDEFADCMIPKMLSPAQRKAYACAKKYGKDDDDGVLLSSCLAQTVVGEDEQRYIKQATRCYQKYGQDYDKYPLCMATQNFDEKTATTVSCVTERAKQGQVTGWTIAGCAAGSQLNMNAEATVALQCAMSTGGQPYAFAACTGGQLTVNELTKCFTIGIGGSGCFGDNNTIIKGLRDLGVNVQSVIGPNGFAVQTYNNAVNDIRYGPGANNEVVKAINTVNHDLTHGLGKNNDLRKAAESIGLGGLF